MTWVHAEHSTAPGTRKAFLTSVFAPPGSLVRLDCGALGQPGRSKKQMPRGDEEHRGFIRGNNCERKWDGRWGKKPSDKTRSLWDPVRRESRGEGEGKPSGPLCCRRVLGPKQDISGDPELPWHRPELALLQHGERLDSEAQLGRPALCTPCG